MSVPLPKAAIILARESRWAFSRRFPHPGSLILVPSSGIPRWFVFSPGHLAGWATQKAPVIGFQPLDLRFGNHSCLCSWGPLGKQNALPTPCGYGRRGAPECGGGFEAAEQASHWLNAGTPTPMVLPGPRFEI